MVGGCHWLVGDVVVHLTGVSWCLCGCSSGRNLWREVGAYKDLKSVLVCGGGNLKLLCQWPCSGGAMASGGSSDAEVLLEDEMSKICKKDEEGREGQTRHILENVWRRNIETMIVNIIFLINLIK